MKLKDDLVLRKVADQYVIVPVGKRVQEVTSIVYISSSAAYLWDFMKDNEFEVDDLVKMIMEHYDEVSEDVVRKDVESYIKLLAGNYILDDGKVRGKIFVEIPERKLTK